MKRAGNMIKTSPSIKTFIVKGLPDFFSHNVFPLILQNFISIQLRCSHLKTDIKFL